MKVILGKNKVNCKWCGRFLGWRKGLSYDVKEGTIQHGQGLKKPYLNFCNRTCKQEYNFIIKKIKK